MTNRIVVFLGPSLGQEEASRILDANYQPPAAQGDVVRAVTLLKADCIVLIDGVFAKAPAVRHKEILWALDRGIRVYGAASMGALRAAELHAIGMKGHGLIYRWYRATPLADDDEVAVAMMPAELGSQAMSEALIDIRLNLRRAVRYGIISLALRRRLEAIARDMHFIDRTYAALFDNARKLLPNDEAAVIHLLETWVDRHAVRQKRDDAIGLLHHVAAQRSTTPPVRTAPFRMTEAWAADLDAAGLFSENIL
ncbi:TfuA-like protein [Microvirga subterranea]|uniref:TfuA-like core domain-containing protein n=1 Tax=Microvirga subterranea TaxID=186651 RepID=A0A370HR76_9HYPH|nr:TfuA-like protein [Microvirga subterranea]RDI60800.1 hypothetical protein DES45_102188 [Microvirga subterranea]